MLIPGRVSHLNIKQNLYIDSPFLNIHNVEKLPEIEVFQHHIGGSTPSQ